MTKFPRWLRESRSRAADRPDRTRPAARRLTLSPALHPSTFGVMCRRAAHLPPGIEPEHLRARAARSLVVDDDAGGTGVGVDQLEMESGGPRQRLGPVVAHGRFPP